MKEVEKLLELGKEYKITKIDKIKEKNQTKKIIYVESNRKKVRGPECNQFTSSVHDRLKPMHLKSLKTYEMPTEIVQIKRRFICHKCKKKFTEPSTINMKNASITNGVKMNVLKNLKNYNLSLDFIAKENGVSDNTTR